VRVVRECGKERSNIPQQCSRIDRPDDASDVSSRIQTVATDMTLLTCRRHPSWPPLPHIE
jgi:hypothetical protein